MHRALELIHKLESTHGLTHEEWVLLLDCLDGENGATSLEPAEDDQGAGPNREERVAHQASERDKAGQTSNLGEKSSGEHDRGEHDSKANANTCMKTHTLNERARTQTTCANGQTEKPNPTSAHTLQSATPLSDALFSAARRVRDTHYGRNVFIRGLIEFSNYCKNDCLYCGIRKSNKNVHRYRLTEEDILNCCKQGYNLGFRTFVLQGGEDPYFTDERLIPLIESMRAAYPECAITLSAGERSRASYQALFNAGANRYLLRHETANTAHYGALHPAGMSLDVRKECLRNLREIGFQVGSGFMVGSPGQTNETLAEDMLFLAQLQPHMVGIGPFVPHCETPFAHSPAGSVSKTLHLLALLRLMLPTALLPATTALGTLHPRGQILGMEAGANVLMPNLSPQANRKDYSLYNNKLATGIESAEGRTALDERMKKVGYQVVTSRGDSLTPF